MNKLFSFVLFFFFSSVVLGENVIFYTHFAADSCFPTELDAAIGYANADLPANGQLTWNGTCLTTTTDLQAALNEPTKWQILIALNGDNGSPVWDGTTAAIVASALTNKTLSKVLIFDRYADFGGNIPGFPATSVIRSFDPICDDWIDPVDPTALPATGPAGVVGSLVGNYASHGWINESMLNSPDVDSFYLRRSNNESVYTSICYNKGLVYYSTIPMDFYLAGFGGCTVNTSALFQELFQNSIVAVSQLRCDVPRRCPEVILSHSSAPAYNHHFFDLDLYGIPVDNNQGQVRVDVHSCQANEVPNHPGDPDCQVPQDGGLRVRAYRQPGGNGRLYKIGYTTTDDDNNECSGELFFCVPHDHPHGHQCHNNDGSRGTRANAMCPPAHAVEQWHENLQPYGN